MYMCRCAVLLQELARYEIDVRNIVINQLIFPEAGEHDLKQGLDGFCKDCWPHPDTPKWCMPGLSAVMLLAAAVL